MKVTSFYSEGELSPIKVGSVDETVVEVKNLFFNEQLEEEQIRAEIYANNSKAISVVDELRLDFDRIYTKKQLRNKRLFRGLRKKSITVDSFKLDIDTILFIKNEQRYLNAEFKNFKLLVKRKWFFGQVKNVYLFATLNNQMFYLLSKDTL